MNRIIATVAMCFSVVLHASVPEPSVIVHGQVVSEGGEPKHQPGLVVSVVSHGQVLDDFTITANNNYRYTLEIPLEADVGAKSANKARVDDILELKIAGMPVVNGNFQIEERGGYKELNLILPALIDSDNDGIPDSQDSAANNPDIPVKFGNLDIDADGVSNALEYSTGTYNPHADADGDGYSNQDEYEAQTDPNRASSLPPQVPPQGQYSALHVHDSAITYLQSDQGGDFIWNDALGIPISIVPVYWDIDKRIDYLISTSVGTLYVVSQTEQGAFLAPQLISLFTVPLGEELSVGFANIDGIDTPELWAYTQNNLYIFARRANYAEEEELAPYGDMVLQQLEIADVAGRIQIHDLDDDGTADLVASGVDLSILGTTAANTIAFSKGDWDGVSYSLASPVLVTSQEHINNSHFVIINNVGEAGFDLKQDLLLRSNIDQKIYVDLSFNSLRKGAIAESLEQPVVTAENAGDGATVSRALAALNTVSEGDAYALANLDGDAFNTKDLLQDTGSLDGLTRKFRLVKGVVSTVDTDQDGIFDYKDIADKDPNAPLPNGHIDYDFDGRPYAIDGNHSGEEDADNDGMSDRFELVNGLNPNDASDADSDVDGDGINAFQEFMDGTDPFDPDSVITQQAVMVSSIKVFEMGASDMLVRGDDVVVSSQNDTAVKIFDSNSMTELRSLQSSDDNGVSKVVANDDLIIMGNVGGSIEIWDAQSSVRLTQFDRSHSSVTDMAINGHSLFSLHANGDVIHWNLQTLAYIAQWHVYDGFLTSIYAKGDFLYIQASNPEKIMFVWNVQSKTQVYTIAGDAACCEKVVTASDGENLILANSFGEGGIYSMNTNNFTGAEIVSGVDATAVQTINNELYVGRKSGVIDKYALQDGSFIGRVVAPYTYVRKIEKRSGGFLSLHSDGNVYFWENK